MPKELTFNKLMVRDNVGKKFKSVGTRTEVSVNEDGNGKDFYLNLVSTNVHVPLNTYWLRQKYIEVV